MTFNTETIDANANILCKACGLCCTGHLFIWVKLRPAELDPSVALGMIVFRSNPRQRGFSQPCPLWQGQCTIYTSPHYPRACRTYKCKLLKDVLAETTSLSVAQATVEQAKTMIRELEELLPVSVKVNFRERLVARLESLGTSAGQGIMELEFQQKASELLIFYEKVFGVTDVIDKPDDI